MKKLLILFLLLGGMASCVKEELNTWQQFIKAWIECKGEDMDNDGDIDEDDYILSIKGPKGDPGKDGEDGLNAYELWCQHVEEGLIWMRTGELWPKDKTEVMDYYTYLTGKDGDNGMSAYVLWLKAIESGDIIWEGDLTIQDFYEYLKGDNGKDGVDGRDGYTPEIRNGFWWIGGKNTGIPVKGDPGKDGKDAPLKPWISMNQESLRLENWQSIGVGMFVSDPFTYRVVTSNIPGIGSYKYKFSDYVTIGTVNLGTPYQSTGYYFGQIEFRYWASVPVELTFEVVISVENEEGEWVDKSMFLTLCPF